MNKHTPKGQKNGIKAVLFDIDGVLLDSFEANLRFFQDVLASLGYPKPSRSKFRGVFHLPLSLALRHLSRARTAGEIERLLMVATKVPYRFELLSEPRHTRETLEILHRSYKLGIVTSRSRDSVGKRYFPFSKTKKYFSVLVTKDECAHHKPHPGPLLLAARRLKLRPSECVYVGDAHTDIKAGRAAGMKTILYGTKRNKDANAATVSFRRLPTLIKRL